MLADGGFTSSRKALYRRSQLRPPRRRVLESSLPGKLRTSWSHAVCRAATGHLLLQYWTPCIRKTTSISVPAFRGCVCWRNAQTKAAHPMAAGIDSRWRTGGSLSTGSAAMQIAAAGCDQACQPFPSQQSDWIAVNKCAAFAGQQHKIRPCLPAQPSFDELVERRSVSDLQPNLHRLLMQNIIKKLLSSCGL